MPPINLVDSTINNQTLLIVDPSASHLAYCVLNLDFTDQDAGIISCGMLWTSPSWTRGQRFSYMRQCIKAILQKEPIIHHIYSEGFFMNPKQMFGAAVVPTINNIIEMCASEVAHPPSYNEVGPTTWRAILGIQAEKTGKTTKTGKAEKDYKVPTLKAVEKELGKLPDQIHSNVNERMRDLPHDVSDCLAIALAVAKEHKLKKVQLWGNTFYNKIYMDTFKDIAKKIEEQNK